MGESITVFIGCDLGDRQSDFCVLNTEGEITQRLKVRTTPASFTKTLTKFAHARVALEVGNHSRWAAEIAESLGHEVVVANARRVQLIGNATRKTDEGDAELLARLARVDVALLAPVKHRGRAVQADLVQLKSRDALVQIRTALVNHVRGVVKSFGARIRTCDVGAFSAAAAPVIPEELRDALGPILEELTSLSERIKGYDRWAEVRAKQAYPETARLTQVHGVGYLIALAFVLTLEDHTRFKKSRCVGAYLGVTPRKRQSGDRDPELKITKSGDPFLRRLLVNSAQFTLSRRGQDSDLRRWGLKLAGRGRKAAKNKAVIAVARKLAVLLHRLWATGDRYEPLRHSALELAVA
jgi:transposase